MNNELFWYKIYGTTLCSEIEYSHLIPTDERDADIFIKKGRSLLSLIENETTYSVSPITKSHILFCNQVGIFQITDGTTITICPKKGISMDQLTPFVFGYCIAMLFWQRNQLAIHCSAVECDGKALIIAGDSGSGKSTFTTKLLENGFRLMTDDVAIVDISSEGDIMVYPAFPQQKLCRDAVHRNHLNTEDLLYIDEDRDKFAVPRRDCFCEKPCKLSAMLCLSVQSENSDVILTELNGHQKLISFLENNFLFPMFRNSVGFCTEDMQKCLQTVQTLPLYRMMRPFGIDSTDTQLQKIQKIIFHSEEDN